MGFRMRWALYAVLAVIPVIGAVAGSTVASSKAPVYTAEARLSMGNADDVDASAQAQAANFARFLTPAEVMSKLPAGSVLKVSASPIPESNVIRVEAEATDSPNAVEAAKVGARMLQTKVAALAGQGKANDTLARLKQLNRQVAAFQEQVNASGGTGADYVNAQTQLSSVTAQRDAVSSIYSDQARGAANSTLTMLAPAAATGDNVSSRKQIYLLAGAGGGALIAYVLARILVDLLKLGGGPDAGRSERPERTERAERPERAAKAPRAKRQTRTVFDPVFNAGLDPLLEPMLHQLPDGQSAEVLLDPHPHPHPHPAGQTVSPPVSQPVSVPATPYVQPREPRQERPVDRLSMFEKSADEFPLFPQPRPETPARPEPQSRPVQPYEVEPDQIELPPDELEPVAAQAPTRSQPTITLRPHAQPEPASSRRGLTGLRQQSPSTRRTWP